MKRIFNFLFLLIGTQMTNLANSQGDAANLEVSWQFTFPAFGGESLDSELAAGGFDLVAGAQELVDKFPEEGHVVPFIIFHQFPLFYVWRKC